MRPHPRIRKTIKWGGLAAAVLLAGAWVASGRVEWVANAPGSWAVSVHRGRLNVAHGTPDGFVVPDFPGLYDWRTWRMNLGFSVWTERDYAAVHVPLWAPALPFAAAAAWAWRLDAAARRRARVGLCPRCRYDRAGLAAGSPCPECGAAHA